MKRKLFITLASTILLLASCSINKHDNSITVSGIGTALAQPDMALVNINFAHIAPTMKEAKKKTEQTMEKILQILQEEKVGEKDIETLNLNFRTEYEYRGGRRIKLGQRADQSIAIKIYNLMNSQERLSNILDKLVNITNVEVNYINFDIEDKTELYKKSRELAYGKALEKAEQYAQLCGKKLEGVISISENISQDAATAHNNRVFYAMQEDIGFSTNNSQIPTGEQGITSQINVVFSLK